MYDLIRSSWGSEKWIKEGWDIITDDERAEIKERMDKMFANGLPFELRHEKILYVYAFSMLAQLEVLAIQVPLKFEREMTNPEFQKTMHQQLLDEIFHGLVFTKIVHELSAPLSQPPSYNPKFEMLCDFLREEEDLKIAIVLLNLVGEGWIEEIFYGLKRCDIAPEVFEVIIEDEHRHVCEADLYREIGMPEKSILEEKLHKLEEFLFTHVFFQYKHILSMCSILDVGGSIAFLQSLDNKHRAQLKKIKLKPGKKWCNLIDIIKHFMDEVQLYATETKEVPMTPTRQLLFSEWDSPRNPTMSSDFSLDITPLDFFNSTGSTEMLTGLTLQAISKCFYDNPSFRNFYCQEKLYQASASFIGLVVNLPDCGDQLGIIAFKNCHELSLEELTKRVMNDIQIMTYCFQQMQILKEKHKHLADIVNDFYSEKNNPLHRDPQYPNPVITLSNIGPFGFEHAVAPLRPNESLRFTLTQAEKKQVWDRQSDSFIVKDFAPLGISVDHRMYDGNIPMPKIIQQCFNQVLVSSMQPTHKMVRKAHPYVHFKSFLKLCDKMLKENLELTFRSLSWGSHLWCDFGKLHDRVMTY